MLTDEQIDAIEVREPNANDMEFSYTTAEIFKMTKDRNPLAYKVLKHNDLLDETKSEIAMTELIYSIQCSLFGDTDYTGLVDFSIFEIDEIQSLINDLKETLKRMKSNADKVAYFAQSDYEELLKRCENHIKFLEETISKKHQKI